MPKFFVTSDIHSYFTIFHDALLFAGYDETDENHWLIVCGDCFDRGYESGKVLDFLKNRDRCILIKGNHEELILKCMERKYYQQHDMHNGTVATIMQLGGDGYELPLLEDFRDASKKASRKLKPFINKMVDYFETENYIFVHSWIPVKALPKEVNKMSYFSLLGEDYDPDWKEANEVRWDEARWGNPFKMALMGLNQTGKTIVFGHWHTSWFHASEPNEQFGEGACFDIAYDKKNNCIGIDACTAASKKCNVLVIEDEFL